MISRKAIVFGAIFSVALLLFLAFPTRLPFNLDSTLPSQYPSLPVAEEQENNSLIKKISCDSDLYLSQNLGRGQYLQISDGFYYEVSPEDIRLAAYWIGSAPVTFCRSDDDDYPVQITNTYSGVSVRVKLSSYEKIQNRIRVLQAQEKPKPTPPPTPPAPTPPPAPSPETPPPQPTPTTPPKKPATTTGPARPTTPPTRSPTNPPGTTP